MQVVLECLSIHHYHVSMEKTIQGSFSITSQPQPSDEVLQKIGGMRINFEKRFQGDLEATSVVSMIGLMNKDIGSGGYVALEQVTGSIQGKKGSFCLQHSSTMTRGKPAQTIHVIPDSGTEELQNISGEMIIEIVNGEHFYTFTFDFKK